MKATAIIGTAISLVALAACGSAATPTVRPATPTPTVAATLAATPSPSEGPSPSASVSPSPSASPTPTVTTTCSSEQVGPNGTGSVTLSGLTVGDALNLEDTGAVTITSTTYVQTGLAPGTDTYAETNGDTTVASGTFTIRACPG